MYCHVVFHCMYQKSHEDGDIWAMQRWLWPCSAEVLGPPGLNKINRSTKVLRALENKEIIANRILNLKI